MKRLRFGLLAAGLALGLVTVAGIAFGQGDRVSAQPAQLPRHPGTGAGPQPGLAASGDALSAAISAAQRQLQGNDRDWNCLLYTSPSPRDLSTSRMPSSA